MASIFFRSPVVLLYFVVVIVVLLCGGGGGHAHGEGKAVSVVVYDVTHYGAAPSSRNNKDAFLAAWRAACDSTAGGDPALLRFPKGTFAVGAVAFEGPCRSRGGAPVVVIDGVLRPCASSSGRGCALSDDAWITFAGLDNLLVTGHGTLDGGGGGDASRVKTTTLVLDGVTRSTLRGLAFVNSRGVHVNLRRCVHVAAEGLRISAPARSRNTDGVHVGASRHVRVLDSVIGTGDDCVSVGPGSVDVLVSGVTCGPGHGLSVGSLGSLRKEKDQGRGDDDDVEGLVFENCTVKGGASNGVRIKTWPGSPPSRASNITFRDIVVDGVDNPVIIDQLYCPHDHCSNATKPSKVQISDVTFERIDGTSSNGVAVKLVCSEERPCTGVRLHGINISCGHRQCRSVFSNVVRETTPKPLGPSASPAPAPAGPPVEDDFAVER